MEYLSSSQDPNNYDDLPSESLQRAHDENATRSSSPETSSTSVGKTRDAEGDNQRSRKKQKSETSEYDSQIDELQQRLDAPRHHPRQKAFEVGMNCIETKQNAAAMKRKLAEHSHWLQRVSSLMETAPLYESVVAGNDKQSKTAGLDGRLDGTTQPSVEDLGEWCNKLKDASHPRFILNERVRAAVDISQDSAARLLRDASRNDQSFQLPLQYEMHGWEISTGTLANDHLGFSCRRQLPAGSANQAGDVAMTLWDFVQRDEVFRTFVPLVQDSIVTHKESEYSLSCRMLQLSPDRDQQAAATVESIISFRDDKGEETSWQVSMEAVHDHYLCAFAADASAGSVTPTTAPPVKLDLGLQMSKLNLHNKFVMGARVSKTDEGGVDILLAGSAHFDLLHYREPALDLLQHFVSHLPVYEDLYLTPLSEEKAQGD
jgi:hypothetical protein